MDISVVSATPADLPEAAQLLATAFKDDPVIQAFVPGPHDRVARLTQVFASELRSGALPGGQIDLARSDDGTLLGVGVWVSPGYRDRIWAQLRELPSRLSALGLRHVPQALRTSIIVGRHRPREPHWYVTELVVHPTAQGEGIGSQLLRHGLSRADRSGHAVYLEASSPGSRALYTRNGFVDQGLLNLSSDGYPMGMLRPAMPSPSPS